MNHFYFLSIFLSVSSLTAYSDVLPVPDKDGKRLLPNQERLQFDSEYKQLYEGTLDETRQLQTENEAIRRQLENMQQLRQNAPAIEGGGLNNESLVRESTTKTPKKTTMTAPSAVYGAGVQTFAVSEENDGFDEVLPAGSWVRAKLMTGVEANSRYPYNVTLQLDYAFTGPNGYKVPLEGCLTIAEAKADLSIERVIILPKKLSCIRENGEYVERSISGFVAGRDSSNGVPGVYSSKQGKVFLQALIASIAKGAGTAVQMTQFSETVGGSENASVARNFTGNVGQYAAAKGVTDAATLVTDWYLNQAKALLPSISIGSGQDLWIIVTESVNVPALSNNWD